MGVNARLKGTDSGLDSEKTLSATTASSRQERSQQLEPCLQGERGGQAHRADASGGWAQAGPPIPAAERPGGSWSPFCGPSVWGGRTPRLQAPSSRFQRPGPQVTDFTEEPLPQSQAQNLETFTA